MEDRGARSRLAHDDDRSSDPDLGDLGMPAPPIDDADPVGKLVHDLARSDLESDLVEPRFGSEPVDEQIETFLPRRFAQVVRAGHLDCLGDEAVTIETVVAHAAPDQCSGHFGCGSGTRNLLLGSLDPGGDADLR